MSLELNNATYKAFVDFASQPKVGDRTIASIDDKNLIKNEGNLGNRAIVASKNWDFIGNIGRSTKKQDANNATRELFRQSIIDLFGGESKIPESVKTAMKLEDYGKGKPLSARRIRIVNQAVEQHFANFPEAVNLAKAHAKFAYQCAKGNNATVDANINQVLLGVSNDPLATKLVAENMETILTRGNNTLRSVEDACKKAQAIKANVAELRTIANGNQDVMNAGMAFLSHMRGKPLESGLLTRLFNEAKALSVSDIKGLKADSSGIQIHKAVMQFTSEIDKAILKSGAAAALEGTDEKGPARDFIGSMMLLKCGKGNHPAIFNALHNTNSAKVLTFYTDVIAKGRIELDEPDDALTGEMKMQGSLLALRMSEFDKLVAISTGKNTNDYKGLSFFPEKFDYEEIDGPDIAADVEYIAKNKLIAENKLI